MKKLPVFILASVLLFSCAGVGGGTLTPEQQEIAVRAVLGSSGYAATAVNQAVGETGESVRAVLLNEKNLNLDGNGSTADCKISATCGASVTVRMIIKALLVDAVSEVTLSLDELPVNCTAVLNGNLDLELKEKISATTQNVGVSLQIANGNKDGIGLKVTRTDTGEVIFDQPVFILFDTSYDITGGSSASVQADVSCKINGERYESEWLTSWSSDDYLM